MMQGMEGSSEPVSPFDSYVDLNPQASPLVDQGPRVTLSNVIPQPGDSISATSAPARMTSLEEMASPHASPSSTGEALVQPAPPSEDAVAL